MNISNYRRRVRRIEREVNAAEHSDYLLDKYVPGNFVAYTVSLPEGTQVPDGSRVVKDFYPFRPRRPAARGLARGFTAGYWRERITADPNDNGVRHDTPEPEDVFDAPIAPAEKPDEES